ncbi:hypothetical protein BZL29_1456 [Mycobacterium kansasii]|uniref:Uncharacterized protein n=1 Tax=Mycobacterium kansasii TaxID=1768 RepID=A0A1V3XX08_MYCKA|nr:hypothetical protein BZL29_1456 [Mycobacterium kansasii]
MSVNQATRGCAAAAIDSEAGPNHGSVLSRVTIDSKQDAAVLSSTAMPFHAAAAATSSAAPAPAYMRVELTSGGRAPKSTEAFRF